MISDETIEKAKELALQEIKEYGVPGGFEIINDIGKDLAKRTGADKRIVLMGTILMDLKLGEALKNNVRKQHVTMSSRAAKKFLENSGLTNSEKVKVINCIEAHHREVPFICSEAEICCNADCYRFLAPKLFLTHYYKYAKKGMEFDKINDALEQKIDEKMKNLTLDFLKQELEPYYKVYKDLIKRARE